jgi:hypothetical protein
MVGATEAKKSFVNEAGFACRCLVWFAAFAAFPRLQTGKRRDSQNILLVVVP